MRSLCPIEFINVEKLHVLSVFQLKVEHGVAKQPWTVPMLIDELVDGWFADFQLPPAFGHHKQASEPIAGKGKELIAHAFPRLLVGSPHDPSKTAR